MKLIPEDSTTRLVAIPRRAPTTPSHAAAPPPPSVISEHGRGGGSGPSDTGRAPTRQETTSGYSSQPAIHPVQPVATVVPAAPPEQPKAQIGPAAQKALQDAGFGFLATAPLPVNTNVANAASARPAHGGLTLQEGIDITGWIARIAGGVAVLTAPIPPLAPVTGAAETIALSTDLVHTTLEGIEFAKHRSATNAAIFVTDFGLLSVGGIAAKGASTSRRVILYSGGLAATAATVEPTKAHHGNAGPSPLVPSWQPGP